MSVNDDDLSIFFNYYTVYLVPRHCIYSRCILCRYTLKLKLLYFFLIIQFLTPQIYFLDNSNFFTWSFHPRVIKLDCIYIYTIFIFQLFNTDPKLYKAYDFKWYTCPRLYGRLWTNC